MRAFLCALAFLTRIPVPRRGADFAPGDFRQGVFFFPVVGLLLGCALAGCWLLGCRLLPPLVTGALVLLAHLLLTGGLHFDGLVDTLDGFCGGRSREEVLRIMKDTRVGALGVGGAVGFLLLRFSLYAGLAPEQLPLLVAAPVAGRQVLVWAQVLYPYARERGMGELFPVYGDLPKFGVTTAFTAAVFVLLGGKTGLLVLAGSAAFFFLLARSFSAALGGLTGDTYGALCELTETFALLLGLALGGRV